MQPCHPAVAHNSNLSSRSCPQCNLVIAQLPSMQTCHPAVAHNANLSSCSCPQCKLVIAQLPTMQTCHPAATRRDLHVCQPRQTDVRGQITVCPIRGKATIGHRTKCERVRRKPRPSSCPEKAFVILSEAQRSRRTRIRSHPLEFVISTEAKRSGETCCCFPLTR